MRIGPHAVLLATWRKEMLGQAKYWRREYALRLRQLEFSCRDAAAQRRGHEHFAALSVEMAMRPPPGRALLRLVGEHVRRLSDVDRSIDIAMALCERAFHEVEDLERSIHWLSLLAECDMATLCSSSGDADAA